jgi:hypothetical protein
MTYRTLPSERTSYVAFAIALAWKSRPRCLRSCYTSQHFVSQIQILSQKARFIPPPRVEQWDERTMVEERTMAAGFATSWPWMSLAT